MKWMIFVMLPWLAMSHPLYSQENRTRFEGAFSASAVIVDGTIESSLFLRAARPVYRQFFAEGSIGIDHRRQTATFIYSLALRRDWPQRGWTPFLLAGVGGETVIVGPYLETRPLFLAGTGVLLPIHTKAFLRFEYQFQRINATAYHFNRHYFLLGFLLRWSK